MQLEIGNGSKRPVWMDGMAFDHIKSQGIVPDADIKKNKTKPQQGLTDPPKDDCNCERKPPKVRAAATSRRTNCRTIVVGPIPGYNAPPSTRTVCDEVPTMWNYNGLADNYLYMQGYVDEHFRWYDSLIRDMMKRYNHPGKKDWNSMSDREKAEHFLKAIQYVYMKEGASGVVNLNEFFINMPMTSGEWTGGTHYSIRITLVVDGTSFPIVVSVPVDKDLRSFQTYYTNGPDYKPGGAFGGNTPQMNYYFGFIGKGGAQLGPQIFVPYGYENKFQEFLYGKRN